MSMCLAILIVIIKVSLFHSFVENEISGIYKFSRIEYEELIRLQLLFLQFFQQILRLYCQFSFFFKAKRKNKK